MLILAIAEMRAMIAVCAKADVETEDEASCQRHCRPCVAALVINRHFPNSRMYRAYSSDYMTQQHRWPDCCHLQRKLVV